MKTIKTLTRWTTKALIRIAAGLTLGFVASSGISVLGKDASSNPPLPITASNSCEGAFAASCKRPTTKALDTALKPVKLTPNKAFTDKPDDGAYFTEASNDRRFDPCSHWDGSPYSGSGTVLNPHADTTECLPEVLIEENELIIAQPPIADIGNGDIEPATAASDKPIDYLDVFGPGTPFFGGLPSGGGIPIAQIITGAPTIPGDTSNPNDVATDPVPIPAPAALFLTGFAVISSIRRKNSSSNERTA